MLAYQRRAVPSRDPVTTRLLSGEKAADLTPCVLGNGAMNLPVRPSHSWAVPSSEALTPRVPSGENAVKVTSPSCWSVAIGVPGSHRRTVASSDAVTTSFAPGENDADRTQPSGTARMVRSAPFFALKTRARPSVDAVTMYEPSREYVAEKTAPLLCSSFTSAPLLASHTRASDELAVTICVSSGENSAQYGPPMSFAVAAISVPFAASHTRKIQSPSTLQLACRRAKTRHSRLPERRNRSQPCHRRDSRGTRYLQIQRQPRACRRERTRQNELRIAYSTVVPLRHQFGCSTVAPSYRPNP